MTLTCIRCNRSFEYNELVGYSERPPICGVHCDYGLILDKKNTLITKLTTTLQETLTLLKQQQLKIETIIGDI